MGLMSRADFASQHTACVSCGQIELPITLLGHMPFFDIERRMPILVDIKENDPFV